MIGKVLRLISTMILVCTLNHNSHAMSTVATVNRAKTTFYLSEVIINEPKRIVSIKTDIEVLYGYKNHFPGLNNKVFEKMSGGYWLLKNTEIMTVRRNDFLDSGYSISTDKAGCKACKASNFYYSNGSLGVRHLLIDNIENRPCKLFSKQKITLIF